MNKTISKYGTFIIIPPVLAVLAIVALRFKVTTTAEVTLVQTAPDEIAVYTPLALAVADSLEVHSPEFGQLTLAVKSVREEATLKRLTCGGDLPPGNTMVRASVTIGHFPICQVLSRR